MAYGNGGGTPMAYTATQTPQRVSMISEQMLGLEKSVEEVHQLISELSARLDPVLTAEPPTATGGGVGVAPQPGAQLAASIGAERDRVLCAARRLRGLIERIEL